MEGADGTLDPVPPPAKPLDSLFDQGPEDDPFAQINDPEEPQDIPHEPTRDNEPTYPTKEPLGVPGDEVDPGERDFGDLLAEFEAEQAGEAALDEHAEVPDHKGDGISTNARPGVSAPAPDPPAPIDTPSGLFDDTPHGESFDLLVGSSAPEEEDVSQLLSSTDAAEVDPAVPQASASHKNGPGDHSMQSSLADDSDWLADTSLEESFGPQPGNTDPSTPPRHSKALPRQPRRQETENGDDPVSFEVPQGWFDDAGKWNWYTDEQREQVRLAMTGQGGWDQDGNDANAGYNGGELAG